MAQGAGITMYETRSKQDTLASLPLRSTVVDNADGMTEFVRHRVFAVRVGTRLLHPIGRSRSERRTDDNNGNIVSCLHVLRGKRWRAESSTSSC
ncbi:MAG: hypothetical protein MZU97_24335 [Bacillus subtilis]|nr:hypothetical protein [Bacillus subtilis]